MKYGMTKLYLTEGLHQQVIFSLRWAALTHFRLGFLVNCTRSTILQALELHLLSKVYILSSFLSHACH